MNSNFLIFVVEDDKMYNKTLSYNLSRNPENEIVSFFNGQSLLDNLHKMPKLITLDHDLPDFNGETLLKQIKINSPGTEVIIVSGQEEISTAVQLLQLGAYDYIVKDENTNDRIWKKVQHVRDKKDLIEEVEVLRTEVKRKYDFSNIIGESEPIKKVLGLVEKAGKSNISVSITGETGTGKEVIAKAIHYNSDRAKKPFIAINVSAIPENLLESELFGYEKGAFTGADSRKIGKFEAANGGTLFLDEIAEMDMSMQTKLLRVLQERELTRIGGNKVIELDVKIISATHKDLKEEVTKGTFREDLFFRVFGLPIHIAPLRDRGNDILLLAKHFVNAFAKQNKSNKLRLSESAQKKLLSYSYPGNVREIKSVIDLACVMCDDDREISDTDITFHGVNKAGEILSEERTLKSYNDLIIDHFLEKYNNNVVLVAKKLDIGKSTIYRLLKERQ